ncbi:Fanconi anemia group J protein homolog isoform X2 [Amphibalanus amphitrite]|uniref:Fanconi anemia group J protein homolog isoform X2 n=1 Tax=Amphibalanus amphitrite TaxID=1232801 RepID=UPI001C912DA8|nr:Fanconi anemia group J protein homolog isoform X2 [Amphibalanus amphitrite]
MGRDYTISGVKVAFPENAYPCQMAMMAKIMQGLKRGQNCLLESPTGSGKTLALLCASLAWQQAECERVDEYNRKLDMEERAQTQELMLREIPQLRTDPAAAAAAAAGGAASAAAGLSDPSPRPGAEGGPGRTGAGPPAAAAAPGAGWDGDEDDFQTMAEKTLRTAPPTAPDVSMMDTSMSDAGDENGLLNGRKKRLKKPKIYFGTRTHKQIAQITRELRRTNYKHAKMTILASRDHTCIHPDVSRSANKNDGCRDLRDPHNQEGSCGYFTRANQRLRYQEQLPGEGLSEAWSLEELVGLGRRIRACPYYAGRNLKEDADIVFCPYNYLIEPSIRESMEISLKNQVVILDEAHNVEDSSREAASGSFQQAHIQDAIRDLEKAASGQRQTQFECRDMARMLSHISQWMDRHSDRLDQYKEFDRGCRVFSGTEMVAHFTAMGIGHKEFPDIQRSYGAIIAEEMDNSEEALQHYIQRLTSGTTALLGGLVRELSFIYQDDMKYRDDFRVALMKSMSRADGPGQRGGWLSSRRKSADPTWTHTLHFWCMNPAVVFGAIGEAAHSVIVASGTLSPLGSFQSELGVPFPINLEASHVISADQVYVSAISHGPRGGSMNATYRNSEQFSFQDELGELLLGVCAAIPNGVLCFFPSYSMLDKLARRWQMTGLWDRLEARKPVLCEPRRADEFEDMMRQFRHLVTEGDDTGALLLAVCRGKLSEGIDFSDDSARAVVTVGIPFPNVKDVQVDLKKQYNSSHVSTRGLLSGHEWYGIQAYRALNQALGRCIRHRYDWGAILLVDDRFGRPRGVDGLSKWVRSLVRHQSKWPEVADSLRQFAADMQHWTEERREEQRKRKQEQDAAEAEKLAAAAAATATAGPVPAIDLNLSGASSPMSVVNGQSPVAAPAVSAAQAQFQYGSPPVGVAGGARKLVLVPVNQFASSAAAQRQEVITVNGRKYLRLTEDGRTRLVPLLTSQGTPVLDGAAGSEHGDQPGADGSAADGRQAAAPAEERPPPSGAAPADKENGRPQSPPLFGEDEGKSPRQVVVCSAGKRPLFKETPVAPSAVTAQADSQSPELVRKTVLPPRGSAAKQRSKRSKGVIFISSDEEDFQ